MHLSSATELHSCASIRHSLLCKHLCHKTPTAIYHCLLHMHLKSILFGALLNSLEKSGPSIAFYFISVGKMGYMTWKGKVWRGHCVLFFPGDAGHFVIKIRMFSTNNKQILCLQKPVCLRLRICFPLLHTSWWEVTWQTVTCDLSGDGQLCAQPAPTPSTRRSESIDQYHLGAFMLFIQGQLLPKSYNNGVRATAARSGGKLHHPINYR